ncbi:UNVERIFIED_CONTAM: Fatty acid desaturase 4, chloroplastic [Sesamum indicum]
MLRRWLRLRADFRAQVLVITHRRWFMAMALPNVSCLDRVCGGRIGFRSLPLGHRQLWQRRNSLFRVANRGVSSPSPAARRQLADLYIQAAAVTAVHSPINMFCNDPFLLGCMGVFSSCMMFSQQFHAWSHTPKWKLPPLVVALQGAGIILGRAEHAAHHRPPYNSNYCIVSGVLNRFLDKFKFFLALEVVVFRVVGVWPRSWGEPNSD